MSMSSHRKTFQTLRNVKPSMRKHNNNKQIANNTNYMQSKRVSVCNKKTQNCVLNDTETIVINLTKDRHKH